MNITWVLIFIVQAITQVLLHYLFLNIEVKRSKGFILHNNKLAI
jgi:hypothetical protein